MWMWRQVHVEQIDAVVGVSIVGRVPLSGLTESRDLFWRGVWPSVAHLTCKTVFQSRAIRAYVLTWRH